MGGVSLLEGGVHLDPVTGDVQCYQELEQEEVGRVEVAQDHYETRRSNPEMCISLGSQE